MKFEKESVPFTMVANEVLNSTTLSWKAKGLYAYLFSKPDTWQFSHKRIKADGNIGSGGILSGLKELEEAGYLVRKKKTNGRMEYALKHSKINITTHGEPGLKKPYQVKALPGKTRTISNIDKNSNTEEESNTLPPQSVGEAADGSTVNKLIDAFAPVNPSFTRFYRLKVQRDACRRLIKQHGIEKILSIVAFLPRSNGTSYAPTITTPDQLEMKFAALIAWAQKEKQKANKATISSV